MLAGRLAQGVLLRRRAGEGASPRPTSRSSSPSHSALQRHSRERSPLWRSWCSERGPSESTALLKQDLAIAREHGLYESEYNALFNLSDLAFRRDRYEDALDVSRRRARRSRGVGLADRRMGRAVGDDLPALHARSLGRGARRIRRGARGAAARRTDAELPERARSKCASSAGETAEAARLLSHYEPLTESADLQNRTMTSRAAQPSPAQKATRRGAPCRHRGSRRSRGPTARRLAGGQAGARRGDRGRASHSAIRLGLEALVASIEAVPPGLRSPYLGAQALRFRARLAGVGRRCGRHFDAAAKRFRELGVVVLARRHAARARRADRRLGAPRRGARDLRRAATRRPGSNASSRIARHARRCPHDLRVVRPRQRRGPEVLRRVRLAAAGGVRIVRRRQLARPEVLRRVRVTARMRRRAAPTGSTHPRRALPQPSAASSPSSSPTSSASRRRPRAATPRRRASSSRSTSRSRAASSSATAAPSRSSSATRSWRSGARRSRPRTTPSEPSAPRSSSWPRSRSSTRRCRHAPECSPARPRSRSAPRARAWSPATS